MRARDGARVAVVLATEITRGRRDGASDAKGNLEERHIAITSQMAPLLSGLSAINCFREGQILLTQCVPGPEGDGGDAGSV